MPRKSTIRFTAQFIKALRYDPSGKKNQRVWGGGEDKGLGINLSKTGDHTWIARLYIQKDGRRQKRIVNLFPEPLTIREKSLEDARRELDVWLGEAAQGIDPKARHTPGQSGPARVSDLFQVYLDEWVAKELEPGTLKREKKLVPHIERSIGDTLVADLKKRQVLDLRDKMRAIPETFNKLRMRLGSAYKLANQLDWTWAGRPIVPEGFNPITAVPYFRFVRKPGDPFDPDEQSKLVAAAERYLRPGAPAKRTDPCRGVIALFLFLLYTGLRENEAIGLTWQRKDLPKTSGWRGYIDARREIIHLIHHKTSRRHGPRVVPLSKQALRLLEIVRGESDEWVFPGSSGKQIVRPYKAWTRLQREAGVRRRGIHQTRHTFITSALEAGVDIAHVAKAVGHSTTYMTETYGHVSDKSARKAAEGAGRGMHSLEWSWLNQAELGEVA